MTPAELQEIVRAARQAAVAHKACWPVRNPHVAGSEAAKVWQSQFDAALKGVA